MRRCFLMVICTLFVAIASAQVSGIVVFQSDFGLKDGAVSAMKGVAVSASKKVQLFDLTHEIPPYSIWDGAYRLYQTVEYWPKGTVFVSVVDPGVGSERASVVAKLKNGQFIVTPDNGTLTLLADAFGIEEIRIIDEAVNRRQNSEASYTFHGRDVYAYTGARLAGGVIKFEKVGRKVAGGTCEMIPYQKPDFKDGKLSGTIPILDVQYGNVWTNVTRAVAANMHLEAGKEYAVTIYEGDIKKYSGRITFGNTFSDVPEGACVMYYNSLDCLSFAINMDDFAATYGISYGGQWRVEITE
ncbi:MAG: S-adenosyl-l-methionine hydroxide adenosyltransferase family protein [Treponema sp.]|nr:S-adenosyl-l-methionine hydroxide adenosyltransferase family protein [Treponema sp.]